MSPMATRRKRPQSGDLAPERLATSSSRRRHHHGTDRTSPYDSSSSILLADDEGDGADSANEVDSASESRKPPCCRVILRLDV
jgi:hypothetical protein